MHQLLDYSVLASADTYPSVCFCLFRRIPLSRDRFRFVYSAVPLRRGNILAYRC